MAVGANTKSAVSMLGWRKSFELSRPSPVPHCAGLYQTDRRGRTVTANRADAGAHQFFRSTPPSPPMRRPWHFLASWGGAKATAH